MNNLAATLSYRGGHVGAQEMHERVLAVRRRVLGEEHPDTSLSAWNLILTLRDSGKVAEAGEVLRENLLWLLDRDPETLTKHQQEIREQLPSMLGTLRESDA